MIIYNITFHIDNTILDECLDFIKKQYIPLAMEDKIVVNPQLCKIMMQSADGSSSYSLQFYVESAYLLDIWQQKNGARLNNLVVERFADKVLGFATLLEIVNHTIE